MSVKAQETLQQYFGFDQFRPLQEEIIDAVLEGHDVLALMPTGGGKSLCYQVPALVKEGLCLVISPLIALMNDQVKNLRNKNITAFSIHTGMSRRDVVSLLESASLSNCKFLFVSPERLETNLFREYLPALNVQLIAVDEAHCISQWGYDFRPPYLRIIRLREELPGVPLIALTASATPTVQADICERLSPDFDSSGMQRFKIFRQSFERPNLSYSVIHTTSRIQKIVAVLNKIPGSAIVYCKTRKRTKEISELLNGRDIEADFYHAGLTTEERNRKQQEWIQNRVRVIVCTNAFGMGIDKPDVRVVLHADVPDCLENYYQEAGRAGRDGNKAYAVLLYNEEDRKGLQALPDLRYPNIETIRNVYRSVVHYLQLPEGELPGDSYDFNLKDFIKKFGLNVLTTLYGLKALEQDGWLSFNDQVFAPATVRFCIYKNDLYEYERRFAQYEPLIKTLLRTYEGIYDYPVAISESYLAHPLRTEISTIKEQLRRLHFDRIIVYEPQKDEPQVMLTRPRIKTSLLHINNQSYNERKAVFTDRVQQMLSYLNEEKKCRSQIIGHYFGDEALKECGICDICLSRKKTTLTEEKFNQIAQRLKILLQDPRTVDEVISELHSHSKDHIWAVIQFLVDEGSIFILEDGKIKLSH